MTILPHRLDGLFPGASREFADHTSIYSFCSYLGVKHFSKASSVPWQVIEHLTSSVLNGKSCSTTENISDIAIVTEFLLFDKLFFMYNIVVEWHNFYGGEVR